ncbi:hypothetical protein HYC85_009079 [Camellia sinensis]|uniref:Transmembrane protein n=1 Tax=Camellia sinensis TaxID=4442 RepID=A0A7J7HEU1_CAMSI|nr:hypothetical protein HYC85_009079 [Camellia sinensis]
MNQNQRIEVERNQQELQTVNQNARIQPERDLEEEGVQTMNQEEKAKLAKNLKKMQTIIEKQDERIEKLQSTAFQLANFYFIFQGVIFTVVSNGSSAVKCDDWWFPFLLSLIATSLNLFALLVIGTKYKRSLDHQEENCRHYQEYEQRLLQRGSRQQAAQNRPQQQAATDPFTKKIRSVYLFLCMSLFVVFSVLTLIGCWWNRCKEMHDVKNLRGGNDDKCVKLCDRERCIRVCPDY